MQFSADASDKAEFDKMLGKPLRKVLEEKFPEWSAKKMDAEIEKVVAHAQSSITQSERPQVGIRWQLQLDSLLFEFLKIAYEMWFRKFGYDWLTQSPTAKLLRTAILEQRNDLPIKGMLFSPTTPLPGFDPGANHSIVMINGVCDIRLFTLTCTVECEDTLPQFMIPQEEAMVVIQDFKTGKAVEERLSRFIALLDFRQRNFEHCDVAVRSAVTRSDDGW